MWTFVTQLLVTLVLLGFFLASCQNVAHIVRGSLGFVLKHVHQELDKELGESEGLSNDEETVSTRVVRRRVLLKVTRAGGRGGRQPGCPAGREVRRPGCGGRWACAGPELGGTSSPSPLPVPHEGREGTALGLGRLALRLLLSTASSGKQQDPPPRGAGVCGRGVLPLKVPSE